MAEENRKYHERYDFLKGELQGALHEDPMKMFSIWYQEVSEKDCAAPHTVVFSTASKEGIPASRIVYMRELVEEGFIIYTNYKSRKGEEIVQNPNVSLLFYWDCMERQVRIEGKVDKIDSNISDDYFDERPRISKIGAWASEQSQQIDSRATLEERVAFFEKKFPNKVPRPPHWGGYIVKPSYFEFWQGRLGRLHDRICFEQKEEKWEVFRIAP